MPLLSDSFPALKNGSCSLCRRRIKKGEGVLLVEDAIKKTFTNLDLLNPRAKHICVACAFCLRTPELRRRDFIATPDGIEFLRRDMLREKLLSPVERDGVPFVFCVGLSHKKHLVIRARVNLTRELYYVQFEEKHKSLLFSINALREAGIRKSEIKTGFYNLKKPRLDILELEKIRRNRSKNSYKIMEFTLVKGIVRG